jgi:hypothetical protein
MVTGLNPQVFMSLSCMLCLYVITIILFYLFLVLEIEHRASCILNTLSTTESHLQPYKYYFKSKQLI